MDYGYYGQGYWFAYTLVESNILYFVDEKLDYLTNLETTGKSIKYAAYIR